MVRVFSGGVGGDTRAQSWLAVSGCGEVQTMCIERCMGAAGLKVRGQPQWQTRSGEAPPVDRPLPCAISICPRRRVESAHGNAGPPRLARRRPSHHAASFGSDTTSPHVSRRRAARRAPPTWPPAPSWRPPLRQQAGRQHAGRPRRRRGRLPPYPRVRTAVAGTGAASALPRGQSGKADDTTTRGDPLTSCFGGRVGKKTKNGKPHFKSR